MEGWKRGCEKDIWGKGNRCGNEERGEKGNAVEYLMSSEALFVVFTFAILVFDTVL